MNGPVERWQMAADAFDQRYKAIAKTQWEAATPCAEWNVHQLVAHAVGVQSSFGAALGSTVAENADWPTARAAMATALAQPGVLDGTVNHPALGEAPKAMLVGIATNDLLIHTWDLARAIGADERLPTELATAAYEGLKQLPAEAIRAPGRFDAAVEVPADADIQTKLLAFAGRKP